MSETLIAMVALMVTVFFAVSQQRGVIQADREIASMELEVVANAVGSELMQQIAVKPFDAATIGVNPHTVALTDLTPKAAFGNGLDCPAACGDIDDFNQMVLDTVFFEVSRDALNNPQGFNFVMTASVEYVDAAGNVSPSPTWTKAVTVFIDQAVTGSQKKFLLHPVRLKQQFAL